MFNTFAVVVFERSTLAAPTLPRESNTTLNKVTKLSAFDNLPQVEV